MEVPAPETEEDQLFGYEQTVGDFNKDGFDDIYVDHDSEKALGYLIYESGTLSELISAVLQPIADDGSASGTGEPGAGDVNGDGYDDLVLPRYSGTWSEVMVFLGRSATSALRSTARTMPVR